MSMSRVELIDVTVDAPNEKRILGPLSLDIREHRVALIGANGSGKSTLARLVNGLNTPSTGRVVVHGLDVASRTRAVRRKVGFIFSEAENQIVMPLVRDDVAFSLRRSGLSKAQRNALVDQTLARFGLLKYAERSPHTLSGGQKQLLALASVCVLKPDIIVADEPTTLLDLRHRRLIRSIFATLEQQLIVATHDLDLVSDYDRAIYLDNGRIRGDGPPSDILKRYVDDMSTVPAGEA